MPSEHERPSPNFGHRPDLDGFISFCLVCFQNVAWARDESHLVYGEATHKCKGPLSPDLRNVGTR
jgi:hypothetical protein